jgi:Domain of unknown function (DUF4262)
MFKWLKKEIRKEGFGIINVIPNAADHQLTSLAADEDGQCRLIQHWFHYTVGNHGANLPEILVIGGDQRMSGPLAEAAKIMRKRGAAFANGELVSLGGKYPVKMINITCQEVYDLYTCGVYRHYNTDSYSVQQMMAPDREGRYPDDPQCAEPYASFRLRGRDGSVLPWPHLEGVHSH